MDEEPDWRQMLPEDYAVLCIQFANAIHKLVPNAPAEVDSWADAEGRVLFLRRFLYHLKARGHLRDQRFSHGVVAWSPGVVASWPALWTV